MTNRTMAAISIYDQKHRKALEDFTQRLLTQVHHRYDIPYEYLLRDIYDTMVWSAPLPPQTPRRSKKKSTSISTSISDAPPSRELEAKKESNKEIKKKKKLRHLELLVVDDGEPFWVDAKTGLLYTYKNKVPIASLHPTLGGSSSGTGSVDVPSDVCSSSKIWM